MSVRNDKPCLHQQGPTQVYVTMGTYLLYVYTKTNKFHSVHSCRNYNRHSIVKLEYLCNNTQLVLDDYYFILARYFVNIMKGLYESFSAHCGPPPTFHFSTTEQQLCSPCPVKILLNLRPQTLPSFVLLKCRRFATTVENVLSAFHYKNTNSNYLLSFKVETLPLKLKSILLKAYTTTRITNTWMRQDASQVVLILCFIFSFLEFCKYACPKQVHHTYQVMCFLRLRLYCSKHMAYYLVNELQSNKTLKQVSQVPNLSLNSNNHPYLINIVLTKVIFFAIVLDSHHFLWCQCLYV